MVVSTRCRAVQSSLAVSAVGSQHEREIRSGSIRVCVPTRRGDSPVRESSPWQYPWLCPNTIGRSSPAVSVVVSQHDRGIRSCSIRDCVLTRWGEPDHSGSARDCVPTRWERSSPAVSVVMSQHDGGDPVQQYPWLCPSTMGEIPSGSIRGWVPTR